MYFLKRDAREFERGMELFYTSAPGIGGRLKRRPEDFVVEEISEFPQRDESGRFVIAKVTSTNWEMNRLVRMISKSLGVSRNRIGFAGTKDKRAVTTQLMSFDVPLESVAALRLHQVGISDAYRSKKPITIGDLIGNSFKVRVRGCMCRDEELSDAVERIASPLKGLGGFPNFFGVQRFGAMRPVTHIVGKHIVRGELEKAVMTYVANPIELEHEEAREARRALQETSDFERALREFPKKLSFERTVIAHLVNRPGDYAGSIASLPGNLQMMFVHAYQSFQFNRILSLRIREGMPLNAPVVGDIVLPSDRRGLPDHDKHVPVTSDNIDLVERQMAAGKAFVSGVLFGSESGLAEGQMGEIERAVIEEEGVKGEDFIVSALPQCGSKGSRRELLARFRDLAYAAEGDDISMSFSLDKGCYATSLLREFMKSDTIDY